jgi:hypothetical protein
MFEFIYQVAADNSVAIFDGVNPEPFVIQPTWPDGTAFGVGEAEAWAEQLIASITDATADFPGDNPSEPTKPRPEPEVEAEEIIEPEDSVTPE